MTLDDFKALRTTMRRRNPAYKIPGRSHQPPPKNLKLYVASDNLSGPDFASIFIIDTTKIKATAAGYEYPPESIMMNLGVIPVTVPPGALCQPQMLVNLLGELEKANRLLEQIAGGWKAVFTPRSKQYWSSGADRAAKVSRFCSELTKALTTPF